MKKRLLALALTALAALVFSGCARHYRASEYQQVVDELSIQYQVKIKVDLGGNSGISPDQLREHLEPIAREQAALQVA